MSPTLIAFLRGTFAYATLLILTRIMGKQQVSQLTYFDYIVGITIGSVAASFTTDLQVNASVHWAGLLTWTLWTLVLGVITVKSRKASKLIAGEPVIVIQNGHILEGNLAKMDYTIDELRMQLREQSVFSIGDVEFALLEPNGKLSVLKKSQLQSLTPSHLQIPTDYMGLPVELIVDGQIVEANLKQLNLGTRWLIEQLRGRGLQPEDVFYAELDTQGSLYIDLRDDLKGLSFEQKIGDSPKE